MRIVDEWIPLAEFDAGLVVVEVRQAPGPAARRAVHLRRAGR
jgi:hypothetical protein